MRFPLRPALALAVAASALSVRADEGMWLFTAPPKDRIQEKYNFAVTDDWMHSLQVSCARFNSGGSGSFVSGDGLVITNHHVGFDAIQKLSSKERNLVRDGFKASTAAEELKCLDLELNVLQSIEDVTARVNAALPEKADAETAFAARRKVTAEIEKESLEKTGLRSDVVTLYQGGAYHLYRYKRYTDVRLVFAPEQQIAFFGGDPDNFEYPRYDLDFSLFRVYEDGKPVRPAHFLKWSVTGAKDGDLTFVAGNPGRTSRLLTLAELAYLRDNEYPWIAQRLKRREVLMASWAGRSEENARRLKDAIFGVQNSRKVRDGSLAALYDSEFWAAKVKAETDFKARLAANPEKFADALAAYDRIAEAQKSIASVDAKYRALEVATGFSCTSFGIARTLLRAGDEFPKPNGDRLREFGDAGKPSLEQRLFSEKPIYEDADTLLLADSLQSFAESFGADDPLVVKVLAGKSPRNRAAELIKNTKVRDVAFRKKLYEGGKAAVDAANDPLIEIARLIDPAAREARKVDEAADETKQQGQAVLAKAHFALEGASNYPDATFTLRVSYGIVKGYEEDGKTVPAFTTIGGLYQRSAEQKDREPFTLPASWKKAAGKVDKNKPFNFVSTHDIIGGNSGSPIVNRALEFVGIIFDGNLQSLSGDFAYDDRQSRALSVSSAGILEALENVYGAKTITTELRNGKR